MPLFKIKPRIQHNYLFVILVCLQRFCKQLVRYFSHTTIRYSAHKLFVSTNTASLDLYCEELQATTLLLTCNFTQSWLNSYWLSSALSCPFVVQHDKSNEFGVVGLRSSLLETSIATAFVCMRNLILVCFFFPHACYFWFACWMDLLVRICVVYIVYTLPLVGLSSSISFSLMIFVLVAFVYCF